VSNNENFSRRADIGFVLIESRWLTPGRTALKKGELVVRDWIHRLRCFAEVASVWELTSGSRWANRKCDQAGRTRRPARRLECLHHLLSR
jgi:hypothetical protein